MTKEKKYSSTIEHKIIFKTKQEKNHSYNKIIRVMLRYVIAEKLLFS